MSALSCLKNVSIEKLDSIDNAFTLMSFKVSNREKITYDMSPIRSRNLPIIWLIGQQNTGKKTHGNLIQEKMNFEHISVSDLLRNEANKDTPRGILIDECLKSHKKISDVIL